MHVIRLRSSDLKYFMQLTIRWTESVVVLFTTPGGEQQLRFYAGGRRVVQRAHPVRSWATSRQAAPCRDTAAYELRFNRLYNGLITLPHFHEALSRWGTYFRTSRLGRGVQRFRSLEETAALQRSKANRSRAASCARSLSLFSPFSFEPFAEVAGSNVNTGPHAHRV